MADAVLKELLVDRLTVLTTNTLEALKAGLLAEPMICVANWANCGINGNEAKPVGCLFSAAYMYTRDFEDKLEEYGTARELFHQLENYDGYEDTIADALDVPQWDMERVITAFDHWGDQESKSKTVTYRINLYNGGTSERTEKVLRKDAQQELVRMIESILESRS